MSKIYYFKFDLFVVIIIEDFIKFRCKLCLVDVRFEFIYCCYEFELKR